MAECLFSGQVPINVKSTSAVGLASMTSIGYHVETPRRLDTTLIELFLVPVGSSKKNLELRLMDMADPLFVWQTSLSEEEYFSIRREQNLLIDFGRFSIKLVEFLQQCIAHAREERPLFAVWLAISEESGAPATASFSIVEKTSFKEICHLTLRLAALTDASLRKYLADLVRKYRDDISGLRQRHIVDSQPLDRHGWLSEPFDITEKVKNLSERCSELESANRQLLSSKGSLEAELKAIHAQLQSAQEETRRLRSELDKSDDRPRVSIDTLVAQNAGLEALVKEKTLEIGRLSEALESAKDSKKHIDETNGQLRAQLSQLESQVRQYSADIAKANEIIRKLQDEIRSVKTRLRTAEASYKQHEKLSRDTQSSYEAARAELQDLREQLSLKSRAISDLEAARSNLTSELEEARKLVEGHEQVIAWLHKEINESHLDRILTKTAVNSAYAGPPFSADSSIPAMPVRLSPEAIAGKAKFDVQ